MTLYCSEAAECVQRMDRHWYHARLMWVVHKTIVSCLSLLNSHALGGFSMVFIRCLCCLRQSSSQSLKHCILDKVFTSTLSFTHSHWILMPPPWTLHYATWQSYCISKFPAIMASSVCQPRLGPKCPDLEEGAANMRCGHTDGKNRRKKPNTAVCVFSLSMLLLCLEICQNSRTSMRYWSWHTCKAMTRTYPRPIDGVTIVNGILLT